MISNEPNRIEKIVTAGAEFGKNFDRLAHHFSLCTNLTAEAAIAAMKVHFDYLNEGQATSY
jgi:hypothetical protein